MTRDSRTLREVQPPVGDGCRYWTEDGRLNASQRDALARARPEMPADLIASHPAEPVEPAENAKLRLSDVTVLATLAAAVIGFLIGFGARGLLS